MIAVDPPVDPWSKQWRIRIAEQIMPKRYEPVANALVPIGGVYQSQPLHAGRYEISVGAQDTSVWYAEELEVDDHTSDVLVPLRLARLRGSVHLGDKPLAATIWIGGDRGKPRIELHSDESGRFAGYVPQREANVWPVTVQSEAPVAKRTFQDVRLRRRDDGTLEADLRLDLTMLQGDVVDEKGAAVGNARVNIRPTEGDFDFIQPATTADGRFAVYGLRPGRYKVMAMHYMRESRPVDVDIRTDEEPPLLRLVVRSNRQLDGRIQSDVGPVVGARVTAFSTDVPSDFAMSFNTNEAGRFSAVVPPAAEQLDIIVEPPGFALKLFHLRWESRELVVLVNQTGGTLTIEGIPPADGVIQHRGATLPLMALSDWQGMSFEANRTTIGMLEAGNYTVCRAMAGGACASGYLPPFGPLNLQLAAHTASAH